MTSSGFYFTIMTTIVFLLSLLTCFGHIAFQTIWAVGIGGQPFSPSKEGLEILELFGFQR
jgi:hypothetical protein